jgi:phospholipid-binding lipoprotein MlaA
VLPLLGQSNLRDLFAMAPATYVYPLTYVADFQTLLEVRTGEEFNRASLNLDAYDVIKKDALDPYTYIRDAYKQMREKKIKE